MTNLVTVIKKLQKKQHTKILEARFLRDIRALKFPQPQTEFKFYPTRQWRFDVAWPEFKLAVEINGFGGQTKDESSTTGRHHTYFGSHNDYEKYNEAMLLGWTVLLLSPKMVKEGTGIRFLERLFESYTKKAILGRS